MAWGAWTQDGRRRGALGRLPAGRQWEVGFTSLGVVDAQLILSPGRLLTAGETDLLQCPCSLVHPTLRGGLSR